MKNISIIVAIAENWVIGKNNTLLWHISEDLKRFKRLTERHNVIMGRKTFLSLPGGALKNRNNIVITDIPGEIFPGCIILNSINEVLEKCHRSDENFIIGGGKIYSQFLEYANKLYLTRIHKKFDGDTFFPEIDFNNWKLDYRETISDDNQNDFSYSFEIYTRKKD